MAPLVPRDGARVDPATFEDYTQGFGTTPAPVPTPTTVTPDRTTLPPHHDRNATDSEAGRLDWTWAADAATFGESIVMWLWSGGWVWIACLSAVCVVSIVLIRWYRGEEAAGRVSLPFARFLAALLALGAEPSNAQARVVWTCLCRMAVAIINEIPSVDVRERERDGDADLVTATQQYEAHLKVVRRRRQKKAVRKSMSAVAKGLRKGLKMGKPRSVPRGSPRSRRYMAAMEARLEEERIEKLDTEFDLSGRGLIAPSAPAEDPSPAPISVPIAEIADLAPSSPMSA